MEFLFYLAGGFAGGTVFTLAIRPKTAAQQIGTTLLGGLIGFVAVAIITSY